MSIATEITRLQGAKADLKAKLENLEVTVPSSDKLDDYVDLMAHLVGTMPNLYKFNWNAGWQRSGEWTYESPSNNYTDIWTVEKDHYYKFYITYPRGTRSRIMFSTQDITQISSGVITGTAVYEADNAANDNLTRMIPTGNKASELSTYWQAPDDGYAIITKTNAKETGIITLCVDYTALYLSTQTS